MGSKLTSQDCENVVKQFLKTDNFSVVDFNLIPGENQNSILIITINQETGKRVLKFFVKPNSHKSKHVIVDDLAKALPQFNPCVTSKLYWSNKHYLIFEDLHTQGFTKHPSNLGFHDLSLILNVLAQIHVAGFAFEKSKSDNVSLDKIYDLNTSYVTLKEKVISDLIVSLVEKEDVTNIINDLDSRQSSSKYRRTLNHGNLKSHNLMFQYKDGNIVECKIINFETIRYVSPICDVLQLIFFNSTDNFRKDHYNDLITHYFNCLKEEMARYQLDVDSFISGEDLQTGVHNFLPLVKLDTTFYINSDKNRQELKEILNCPLISKEDCYVIAKNKLATTNYDFLSFKATPLSEVSGFLGEYHKLEIKVCHLSQNKIINCFIKCEPREGTPQAMAQDLGSFSREVFMYQTLVREFRKLGIDTITECLPGFHFHRPDDLMVFDDMSTLNYQNLPALQPMNSTLLTMAVRKLARFHSCSLIYEEKMSEKLGRPYRLNETYQKYFAETLFFVDEHHLGARSFITGIKSVKDATELFPEIKTHKNQKNFETFWPQLIELFYTVVKTSNRYRNVLSHGDLWTSNMLVKFDKETPVDCVFIDFQIVRYCPPAYDLLSVLHLTTNRSTRLLYEKNLIEIYYEELKHVLQSYGYCVDSVYPYKDFIGCIDYMRPQMVLQAAVDCVLTMCTPEEISSFLKNEEECRYVYFEDRKEFLTAMCQKSILYKTRLRECILDIYDYCDSMFE